MRVFLIHGMGRSPWSFALLEKRLRDAGHVPSSFGYLVSRDSLDKIGKSFLAHVEAELSPGEEYAVIGHSLGGIIARHVSEKMPVGWKRFVMLAPPNRSPRAAQRLKHNALFRALTKDAGQKLADEKFYETLPTPKVATLVFVGTSAPSTLFHERGKIGDSVISAEEAHLEGATHVEVRSIHTFIMNNVEVARGIIDFLKLT
ncbi:MAG: alpha/beta fold hydrolase [Sandaracinaceae bacterium]|nr:alpha/beta fold hydrolase [Sandaracinaceae bacterium]